MLNDHMLAVAGGVDERVGAAKSELVRVESKASALAGLTGAALAVLLASTGQRAGLAGWLGWGSVAAFAASVVLLLLALRPSIGGGLGVMRSAQITGEQIQSEAAAEVRDEHQRVAVRAAEAALLASLAARKYRAIRWAVDLALVGVALAAVATGISTL